MSGNWVPPLASVNLNCKIDLEYKVLFDEASKEG
jgi:hypothetical protein